MNTGDKILTPKPPQPPKLPSYDLSHAAMGCGSRVMTSVNNYSLREDRVMAFFRGIVAQAKGASPAGGVHKNQTCIVWSDRATGAAGEELAKKLREYPELGILWESPEFTNMHYADDHKLKVWGFIANVSKVVDFVEKKDKELPKPKDRSFKRFDVKV